jgi:Zn-dependent membrane protease YugP
MFFPGFWDPTSVLLFPAILFVMWAHFRVNSTFNQWARVGTRAGVTAAEVARDILQKNGIYDVRVEFVHGNLTDHYDPKERVVRLSASTYDSRSIAAIGVAAHEVGHVIQHYHAYVPLTMRNLIFPVARIGDMFGFPLAILGFFFGGNVGWTMLNLGILLFTLAVAFYVVTLPVEYNASSRAIGILESGGYLTREELQGAKSVLNAAALTYVASAAVAISNLLRLLILRNMRDRD